MWRAIMKALDGAMRYPTKKQWAIVLAVYLVCTFAFTGLGKGVYKFFTRHRVTTSIVLDQTGSPRSMSTSRSSLGEQFERIGWDLKIAPAGVSLAVLVLLLLYGLKQAGLSWPILAGIAFCLATPVLLFFSHYSLPPVRVVEHGEVRRPPAHGVSTSSGLSVPVSEVFSGSQGAIRVRVRPTLAQRLRLLLKSDEAEPKVLAEQTYAAAERCLRSVLAPEMMTEHRYTQSYWDGPRKSLNNFRFWREELCYSNSSLRLVQRIPSIRETTTVRVEAGREQRYESGGTYGQSFRFDIELTRTGRSEFSVIEITSVQ